MSIEKTIETRVAELRDAITRNGASAAKQEAALAELIALYENTSFDNPEASQAIRKAFLLTLANAPGILTEEKFSSFLAEHVQPEDFALLEWKAPQNVVSFSEALYGFQFEDESVSRRVRNHARSLLRHALQQFEKQNQLEKMLKLLQMAPILPSMMDSELLRLRNRAYLYEMRRVQRNRRFLYGYLILQALLIFLVFPLLFINAENKAIQKRIEELTEVDLSPPEEGIQLLDFNDALYWSIITAASIGYGDVTPRTEVGRVIAATLGLMGVITIGVIAGLILNWVSPRRLD
ncbi:MAG TPA: potassium channel family protein [Anaerolineae bacterium]